MKAKILYIPLALVLVAASWWFYSNTQANRYYYGSFSENNYPIRIEKATGLVEIWDGHDNSWIRVEESSTPIPRSFEIPEHIVQEAFRRVRGSASPTPERIYTIEELGKIAK